MNYWVKESPNRLTLGTSVFSSLIRGSRHLFVLLSFHSSLQELLLSQIESSLFRWFQVSPVPFIRDAHVTQSSRLPAASSHHCGRTEQTGSPGWRKQKSSSGLCLALLRSLLFNKVPNYVEWKAGIVGELRRRSTRNGRKFYWEKQIQDVPGATIAFSDIWPIKGFCCCFKISLNCTFFCHMQMAGSRLIQLDELTSMVFPFQCSVILCLAVSYAS